LGLVTKRLPFNSERGNVLPQSIRLFKNQFTYSKQDIKNPWPREIKNFGLGKYTVEANISYGQAKKVLIARNSFTIWPIRLIILASVAGILAVGYFLLRKKRG
jgi:hypothetical protein